jgi:hypothetical protein
LGGKCIGRQGEDSGRRRTKQDNHEGRKWDDNWVGRESLFVITFVFKKEGAAGRKIGSALGIESLKMRKTR